MQDLGLSGFSMQISLMQSQLDVIISFFLLSPKTVALVRPGAETTQTAQRLIPNPTSSSVMSNAPLSSLPSPLPSAPVRAPVPHTLSSALHSKLTVSNGTTAPKVSTLNQGSAVNNVQESPQDKQAEQAKLVRPNRISYFTVLEYLRKENLVNKEILPCFDTIS